MMYKEMTQKDATAENILDTLSDLENYPEEALAPYQEFEWDEQPTTSPLGGFSTAKTPVRKN